MATLGSRRHIGDKRHRVLLISVTPFFGGGEVYYSKLGRLLARNYDVAAVASNELLIHTFRELSIQVWKGGAASASKLRRYASTALALIKACREFKPDVIHFNGQGEAYLAPIARLMNLPILITRHIPIEEDIPYVKQRIAVRNYSLAKTTLCVSREIRKQLAKYIDPARLKIVSNWIPAEMLAEKPREVKTVQSPFKLLFVGRLVEYKGITDLVEAMRYLEDVTLDIVGDGELYPELRARAQGLPITFHGFQKDCIPFYDRFDLLVFASRYEGQGVVPMEAMARGIPCLVSDVDSLLEISEDGQAAATFRRGDISDLARQIESLRNDPARLQASSQAGWNRIRKAYTEEAIQEACLAIFEDAIANKS